MEEEEYIEEDSEFEKIYENEESWIPIEGCIKHTQSKLTKSWLQTQGKERTKIKNK
jgi:hypothetical protein